MTGKAAEELTMDRDEWRKLRCPMGTHAQDGLRSKYYLSPEVDKCVIPSLLNANPKNYYHYYNHF